MAIGELDLTENDIVAGQKIYATKVQARVDELEAWANVQVAAKAVAREGDQTIAGIKTFSASPIVPLTPSGSTQAASKGYADSLVTSLVADSDFTPTSYTGGESVTFPNGLIIKMGIKSVAQNSTGEVTYGTAFPSNTGCLFAFATFKSTNVALDSPANARPKSGSEDSILQVTNGDDNATYDIQWFAIGY